MTAIEQARAQAAERFPEHLVDTMGREHPSIPRRALLRGDWDSGSLVRSFVAALGDVPGVMEDVPGG
ncbi:MAG: hypothetical protein PGN16_04100 [Sphingomonas phyllosphaerae]|uniref:hypothetical protein n=1 Tax=Sphingomonas phyllosphaerae TaxID=257003 RepID=UPI002FF8433B